MSKVELIIGGVYRSDISHRPIRIIACNGHQVFYDVWWEHINDWGIKNSLRSRVNYYRTTVSKIANASEFLRVEPLSEAEIKAHRPDLPQHLFTYEKLSWGSQPFANISDCESWLKSHGIDPTKLLVVDATQLALVPQDAKDNNKKSVIAQAVNGSSFTGAELLFHAYNAQAPYMTWEDENGIGLHRLGLEKKMPSYYLGSYYDQLTQAINPSLVKERRLKIQSLTEVKKMYPFKEWRAKYKEGFDQFTAVNCKRATQIADALITGLMVVKDGTTDQKLDLFKTAIIAYNKLNHESDGTLFETEEREELVVLLNTISSLVGLDTRDYGDGEGIAAEWRDW
jgi:hypothetical protein